MNYGCGPRCRCEGIHSYKKKGVREEVTYMKKKQQRMQSNIAGSVVFMHGLLLLRI